ncbi:hypothetical protein ACP70R_029761 [Stipagrostis hirtigluma subsp. patula]
MAGLAGGDPFGFHDYGDDFEFCYDPFDCEVSDDGGDELIVGPFGVDDDGDGVEFCVSGFSFPDGRSDGDDEILVVGDRGPHSVLVEPSAETLGRSFDSDEVITQFLPHLVSALDIAEEEHEEVSGDGWGGGGFAVSGFQLDRRESLEEAGEGDGLMVSGLNLDLRRAIGGFEALVDAHEADDETAGDDGGQGLMPSGIGLRPPPSAGGTFRMLVSAEDTDSDDAEFLDVLAGHVGEAGAGPRRLPASRAAVEGLPEVALSEEEASRGCAVCKDGIATGERAVRLPCKHCFHGDCIRPWLAIKNTCPVCRFELPTGNVEYDRWRGAGGASMAEPM